MKKIIFVTLTALFTFTFCYSQDVITKKTGDDLQVKIIEVGQSEIKFKKHDNQEGPIFTISKSDVLIVRYANGTKDIFDQENKKANNLESATSTEDQYQKGQTDASKYYEGYRGAGTGTLVTGLISPLVGLIPAFACSSAEPKDINLDYPSSELMKNPDYYKGYTQKAKKIKKNKVWKNWGIAFGVNLVAILAMSSAQ